jgi:hypothetical protein
MSGEHEMQDDIITRFHKALPQIREWIDACIESHAAKARQINNWPPLSSAFPPEVFDRTREVLVKATPFPPVSQFGLPEFAQHERRQFDGITFKNTIFVVEGRQSIRLQFHELVHTVQYARLGVDRFLLAYGYGLLKFGYEQSPLERMAYGLEDQFTRGVQPQNLMQYIEAATDAVWKEAAPVVGEPM